MTAPRDRGKTLVAVTNSIIGLHREFYGRGATRGRTIMQENYLVCFLDDIYTKAERTLIDAGRFQAVIQSRNDFQEAMRPRFTAAVESSPAGASRHSCPRWARTRISLSRRSGSSPRVMGRQPPGPATALRPPEPRRTPF